MFRFLAICVVSFLATFGAAAFLPVLKKVVWQAGAWPFTWWMVLMVIMVIVGMKVTK